MDRQQQPCTLCQQLRNMISLAKNRDETELAAVLANVLHLHQQKKHPGARPLHSVLRDPQ
ncbi:hypothetical protein [Streptomyces sp. 3N207]|uniref:hypothetical protein n=1 Tax=Streptomyces sp. 3N207 TaxID=3457417 RepID=UPI003FD3B68C